MSTGSVVSVAKVTNNLLSTLHFLNGVLYDSYHRVYLSMVRNPFKAYLLEQAESITNLRDRHYAAI